MCDQTGSLRTEGRHEHHDRAAGGRVCVPSGARTRVLDVLEDVEATTAEAPLPVTS
jgi:hypothetical protein